MTPREVNLLIRLPRLVWEKGSLLSDLPDTRCSHAQLHYSFHSPTESFMVARCWGRFDGPMSGQLPATRATIKALPTQPPSPLRIIRPPACLHGLG
jgi:hypothetical protein